MRSILGRARAIVSPGPLALALVALTALALGSCEEYPTDIAVIEPPSITGVRMTPDSANVTNDDVEIAVSIGARGSGGVDSVVVVFAGPGDDDELSCVASQPVAGDRTNGDWTCAILLAAGSTPGLWAVSSVELHHGGGEALRLIADDLQEAGYAIDILVLAYLPPLVGIEAPTDGSSFSVGDTVRFEGWASMRIDDGGTETGVTDDTAGSDQVLTDSALVWTSDLDGQLGIGEEFATAALSEGTHLITLTATDENGLSASDSVRVTVEDQGSDYWRGWVAVGESHEGGANVAISLDGINWTGSRLPFGDMGRGSAVASNGEIWVVAGAGAFGEAAIAVSEDALTWTPRESPLLSGSTVAWHDGLWIVGGDNAFEYGPPIAISEDGEEWTEVEVAGLTAVRGIAHNGDIWVAVGFGATAIATSADGRNWTARTAPLGHGASVAWNGELWVVVGTDDNFRGQILTSPDGINWTARSSPITDFVNDVAWNGATWIAVGSSSSGGEPHLAISEDGIEWESVPSPFQFGPGAIAWNGRNWVIGGPAPNSIMISADGLEWQAVSSPFNDRVGGLAWGGTLPINQAPRVSIASPAPGTVVPAGTEVVFQADQLYDLEDGDLPYSSAVWTSDRDGEIGTGPNFTRSDLSVGTHTITLTVTDSYGAITRRRTTIEVEGAPGPELLHTVIFPDSFNVEWLGGDGFEGPEVVVLALIPDPNKPAPDTIDATITGPSGQSFTCAVAGRGDPSDLSPILDNIPSDAEAWGCVFTFGAPVDPLGNEEPDPEELAAALDTIELGTWRITEIGLRHAGSWYTYDEAALDAAGHGQSVELFRIEAIPGVQVVYIDPWRATIPGLGNTVQLYATAYADIGEAAPPVLGVTFTWTSLDPDIATVDQNGLVTGHSPGIARITASAGVITSYPTDVIVFEAGPPIAWDTIIAGPWHNCGLAQGRAYCWGSNEYGQLGTGDTENRFVPTLVAGGHSFTTLALGDNFTVALDANGKAYAWGRNDQGQLGDGTTAERTTPTEVAGDHSFTAISAGNSHVVALTEDGTPLTWGRNSNGQLGDGGMPRDHLVPGPVFGSDILGETFTAVSAGYSFTMALRSDSTLYTWGENRYGQLGHGDRVLTRNEPRPVIDQDTGLPMKFIAIDAGDYHAVALDTNGRGWSWGEGFLGRLGNGTTTVSPYPSRVSGDIEFAWIGAGGSHTMGIGTDGTVWGWGEGLQGQLGNGTKDRYNVPTMIAQIQGFILLSPGSSHTLGLNAIGMAYAWGWNVNGVLGDGGLEDQATPVPVLGPVQ